MTDPPVDGADPHRGQPILTDGRSLSEASAAMILIHGRGASAGGLIGPDGVLQPRG